MALGTQKANEFKCTWKWKEKTFEDTITKYDIQYLEITSTMLPGI